LLEGIREFGWKPSKRLRNLADHKIDFVDVRKILNGYTFIRRSDRYGEIRYQIFGYLEGNEIAVACTIEGSKCHVISARRARKDERRKYYLRL
jgi:uncharacterized DUF497 family protein